MSNVLRARYDLIINGGGIVGFTLLNLINKSPSLRRCKVLLIEQAKKPTSLKQPPRVKENSTASNWDDSAQETSNSDRNFSNRVSSITLSSKKALRSVNAWQSISQYTKDINQIKVWNYDYSDKIVFKQVAQTSKEERDVVFSVVENNRLSLALIEALSKSTEAQDAVTWDSTLSHLEKSQDKKGLVDVTLRNTSSDEEIQVSAPLIVGCDGFKSRVREITGMKYHEIDLNKTAVVGTVKMVAKPGSEKNDVAYQRFSSEKDTVAALLPLDNDYSSFVLSAPNDYAKHLVECDDETFTDELNRLLGSIEIPHNAGLRTLHDIGNMAIDGLHNAVVAGFSRFRPGLGMNLDIGDGGFEQPPSIESTVRDSRALFPLYFGTTSPKMVGSVPGSSNIQVALLGDSAHRVHPLAGQGLNLGIQDATELVKQLEMIAETGENLFNENDQSALVKALKRYECKRQAYIIPMSAGILSMPHLFKLMPSKFVSAINRCEPVKTNSVRFANGYCS